MSTKSNLRAFGAAFTAGGSGIKEMVAKKEASERADTQEEFDRRRVETAEAHQKAQEGMNTKLADMEQERIGIAKSLAKIQKAVEERAVAKHPYALYGLYIANLVADQQRLNLGTLGEFQLKQLNGYASPKQMQDAQFKFTQSQTLLKSNLAINMAGLQYRLQESLGNSAHANTLNVEALRAAKTFFLPGKAGESTADEYFKRIKQLFEATQTKTSEDAVKDSMNEAKIGVLDAASALPETTPISEQWGVKKPPPTPDADADADADAGTPPPPPASDDQIIRTFAVGAAEMGSVDAAEEFLKDAARQEGPAAFPYRLLEKAMEQVRELLNAKDKDRTMRPREFWGEF
jgi:hypothetical protein